MLKYVEIGKVQIRHNVWIHLLIAAAFLMASPMILGLGDLGPQESAKVLELYVSLAAVILLPPLFLPEQDPDLYDLAASKYVRPEKVFLVRFVVTVAVMAVMLAAFIAVMQSGNCNFPALKYYFGTFAEMMFLGGLGIFAYMSGDNVVIGYMVPILYYVLSYGAGQKTLGTFYLFSMMSGNYTNKWVLGAASVVLIVSGIWLRGVRRRQ